MTYIVIVFVEVMMTRISLIQVDGKCIHVDYDIYLLKKDVLHTVTYHIPDIFTVAILS